MARTVILSSVALTTAIASVAMADTVTYRLHDHPDSAENPPPYGLRYDDLFGAGTGVTSFSFDYGASQVFLDAVQDVNGVTTSLHIYGTVFGGVDVGNDYGSNPAAAYYTVDFVYAAGIAGNTTSGWTVSGLSASNTGSLVAADNTSYPLYTMLNGDGESFVFKPDDHRLGPYNYPDNTWVGRGWLSNNPNGQDLSGGTQDWLFTAELIPLPGAAWAGLSGLAGAALVGASRRRRLVPM
jgi:hypothetical protein